ncbi:ImpA family type VI secretion system protein [Marinomonas balearica]|uniref:Type VI secretion system protein ImpA n=1 Tax=Marinomonas balearica TaxID=491947 RepID=A0A4R6M945_9GAMM|nr:type VI secretion system ImpA family N-terminal domain-containing protein [Marinomonas balearica]TDO98028.1 type VI secretion system protein ImpA [Marinomonas balearica]
MFDDLIHPISDDQPSGEYLKDNRTLYRGYRNAFNMAQSSFRQLVETPDAVEDAEAVNANSENWGNLADECKKCLKETSKDVEMFSWFTVSQLFSNDPFNGLAGALTAFEKVVESNWDTLQPTLPEKKRKGETDEAQAKEIAEFRVKPLLQLVGDTAESGLLYMPLQMLPLVGETDYGVFFKAEKSGGLNLLKEAAVAAMADERSVVEERILALGEAMEALIKLEKTLSEKCFAVGAQSISFRFVKDSIERLLNAIKYMVGDQFARWPLDPEPEEVPVPETNTIQATDEMPMSVADLSTGAAQPVAQNGAPMGVPVAAFSSAGAVASREQALSQLQSIADYFLETEPHSPIYLLLKRAIRWGGMSLPELLAELVGDNGSVHQRIEQLAGLESAEHESNIKPTAMSTVGAVSHATAAAPSAVATASKPAEPSIPTMPVEEKKEENSTSTDSGTSSGLSAIEW